MNSPSVCRRCGAPLGNQGAGLPACGACGALLAEETPAAAGRPPLLILLTVFLAFLALFGAIITLITLFMPGNEDYLVDNQLATKGDFLVKMLPSVFRFLVAAPIAYGLWRERTWARPILLAFAGVSELGKYLLPGWREAPPGVIVPRLVVSGIVIGLLGWYLYRKRNVVDYYNALSPLKSKP